MLKDVLERVERRLGEVGITAAAASRAAGLSEDAIRNLKRAAKDPASPRSGVSTRTISALAPVLKTTTGWLLEGAGDEEADPAERPTIPLVGHVGAGSSVNLFGESQGPFEELPWIEGATSNTVAVEIRGESLGTFFDRWIVYYDDVRSPVTRDLVGKLCVVGLEDGRVLVKKIQRSKADGLFHLLSQAEDPILDVPVQWAAPVRQMAPR